METDYSAAKEYVHEEHYYGRVVRRLFMFAGILMLIGLPAFSVLIPVGLMGSVAAIVVIGFVAGLLNPIVRWVTVLNVCISLVAMCVFEYQAVISYGYTGTDTEFFFFVTNQILALIFFFATYYGAKSFRGIFVKTKFVE